MKNTTYLPKIGTLPAQVITFFAANPDEELTCMDIAEKFTCSRHSVHTNLAMCVDAGLLKRITNADSDPAYIATEFTSSAARRIAATTLAPKRRKPTPRHAVPLDKLKVEDDIQIPTTSTIKGIDKWAPVFDKLKKPGQSIELPIEARGAVGAAMTKRNQKLGKRMFCIRIMSETTCRIWRLEAA